MTSERDILQVLPVLQRGGQESWLVSVILSRETLCKRISICVTGPEYQNRGFQDIVESSGIPVSRIPYRTGIGRIKFAYEMYRFIRKHRFKIVHVHMHHLSALVALAARLAGVKAVFSHFHMPVYKEHQAHSSFVKLHFMTALTLRMSSRVLCCAGIIADQINTRHPGSKAEVLYYGIIPDQFKSLPDKSSAKDGLGLSSSCLVVGHVGNFREEKNHAFFIEIAARIVSRQTEARFVLVGDGPQREVVESHIEQSGLRDKFILTGSVANVPDYLAAFDVFILPSHYEGFPMVLLEAQAAGVPCVVSDTVSSESTVIEGMVEYCSLQTSPEHWANLAIYVSSLKVLPCEERLAIFAKRGLTLDFSAGRLDDIYLGTALNSE